MAREDLHFRLRIPEDLKSAIEVAAEKNRRSMTAEIVDRLYDSFGEMFEAQHDIFGDRAKSTTTSDVTGSLEEELKRNTDRQGQLAERLEAAAEVISQSNDINRRILEALEALKAKA